MTYTELRAIEMNTSEMEEVRALLESQRIRLDETGGTVFGFYQSDRLSGTATLSGHTLRSVAIEKAYQGTNTLALMIQEIIEMQKHRNIFVYTSEKSALAFERIGFYKIEKAAHEGENVVLLEKRPDGFKRYLKQLKHYQMPNRIIGAIVMNANPFTLGHQYLIETAARQCDHLYVFAVSEEASVFPFETRMRLMVSGTQHLNNVTVLKGGEYIISQATFPSYFLKSTGSAIDLQAKLDLQIFGGHIAKVMGITRRYFGEEPYCATTNKYNHYMKTILPAFGIEAVEIKRVHINDEAISASRVRRHLKMGECEAVKALVPQTTYDYLTSYDAKKIMKKIKSSDSRH